MAIELETGDFLPSAEQAAKLRAAADQLREDGHPTIDLTRPITFDQWFALVITQAALNGDEETLERIITHLEAAIATRKRPH